MLTYAALHAALADFLAAEIAPLPAETPIPAVTADSRQVTAGGLFAAIPGSRADGLAFVPQAVAAGARIIVSEAPAADLPKGVANLIVTNAYRAFARIAQAFMEFPDRAMRGLAVTGTNGKTTTVMLWRALLAAAKKPCGMISTVEYDLGGGEILEADRTTPEALRLFQYFRSMREHGLDYFAMEVSSHASEQERIGAVLFQAAVFTNLTGDHLDYHRTMEAYFAAKRKLFTGHLAPGGVAVINADDAWGRQLAADPAVLHPVTFGREHGDWRIKNVESSRKGSSFSLVCGKREVRFSTNLVGAHNVANLTGAVLALDACAILALEEAAETLAKTLIAVPGRLEAIELSSGATAFVDYAHTDDALTNVLTALRNLAPNRILTVFGAGGDRDATKRPRMGRAAAALSDELFITSDNPRSENPEAIIEAVASGVPTDFKCVHKIADRAKAIAAAVQSAQTGDFILVAGKGHETYQEIAGVKHHFDDREILRDLSRN